MICIANRGPINPEDPSQPCNYTVGINQTIVAAFKHRRADGLAACLRKAADAVESASWKQINSLMAEIQEAANQPTPPKRKRRQ